MKKGLLLTVVAAFVFGIVNVSAMSEADLKAKLLKSYTVNGVTYKATSGQKNLIEKYFNQYEVSSEDADYISGKIDEIVAVIEKGNATTVEELTRSEKDQIIAIVDQISAKTSVKGKMKNGALYIYNSDGTTFAVIDKLVKQTDSSKAIVIMSGLVSLAGLSLVVRKTAKARA